MNQIPERQNELKHLEQLAAQRELYSDAKRVFAAQIVLSAPIGIFRSEEHTSELQSQSNLVCRLLLDNEDRRAALRVVAPQHANQVRLQCVDRACDEHRPRA